MERRKLVIVGDGGVGKTCLLMRASMDEFPHQYVPTTTENYTYDRFNDGSPYSLDLWDTAGQEEYDRLRPLAYPATDVFLVCFDVGNRDSFENVTEKWVPEVRRFMPDTPILLVGNKTDLRLNMEIKGLSHTTVSEQEGMALAASLGLPYKETSAMYGDGSSELLPMAFQIIVNHQRLQRSERRSGFFRWSRLIRCCKKKT